MQVLRFSVVLCDFLLRDCDTTCFGPAIWQYIKGGIGDDAKTLKKQGNLATGKVELSYFATFVTEEVRTPKLSVFGKKGTVEPYAPLGYRMLTILLTSFVTHHAISSDDAFMRSVCKTIVNCAKSKSHCSDRHLKISSRT